MKPMGTVISQQPARCIPKVAHYSTVPEDVLNCFYLIITKRTQAIIIAQAITVCNKVFEKDLVQVGRANELDDEEINQNTQRLKRTHRG